MVVLDTVRYVEEKIDPTISIRWNCKAGKCGSCSAEINGRPSFGVNIGIFLAISQFFETSVTRSFINGNAAIGICILWMDWIDPGCSMKRGEWDIATLPNAVLKYVQNI